MTTKTQANDLMELANAAAAVGRVETRGADAMVRAVKAYAAAGEENDAIKRNFLCGFMAGYLGLTGKEKVSAAAVILNKKGHAAKVKADARRTPRQDKAYTAARKALSRVRKAAGVAASDTRGGDTSKAKNKRAPQTGSNAPDAKSKAKESGKTPATMIPAMSTAPELAAFMLAMSNKNPKAFAGKEGKELQRAIAAFAKAQSEPAH